jgi:hypothetical protein
LIWTTHHINRNNILGMGKRSNIITNVGQVLRYNKKRNGKEEHEIDENRTEKRRGGRGTDSVRGRRGEGGEGESGEGERRGTRGRYRRGELT